MNACDGCRHAACAQHTTHPCSTARVTCCTGAPPRSAVVVENHPTTGTNLVIAPKRCAGRRPAGEMAVATVTHSREHVMEV